MTEPTTTNVGLIVPNTGDLPGLWGAQALNPDLLVLDGYMGATQVISVSNAPITLTSPAGFTPTPSGGPTQAQNAVLSFTGTMTANVQVTLPLPGVYQVENLTTGNFVLSFRAAGSGEVIAIGPGMSERLYCNGTNVRFASLGAIGRSEMWAGLSSMPAWVAACTKPPYLLEDGAIYNVSDFPYLGRQLGSSFGGNGITTFGVPDSRGRVQLPYDGTGTRITTGGCGLNGQTIGATLDEQTITLAAAQIPTITGTASVSGSVAVGGLGTVPTSTSWNAVSVNNTGGSAVANSAGSITAVNSMSGSMSGSTSSTNTGGGAHPNVPPSQVTGIAVIRAG